MWSFLPLNAFNSKIAESFVKFTVDRFTEMTSEFSENTSSFDSGQLEEMVRVCFCSTVVPLGSWWVHRAVSCNIEL